MHRLGERWLNVCVGLELVIEVVVFLVVLVVLLLFIACGLQFAPTPRPQFPNPSPAYAMLQCSNHAVAETTRRTSQEVYLSIRHAALLTLFWGAALGKAITLLLQAHWEAARVNQQDKFVTHQLLFVAQLQ